MKRRSIGNVGTPEEFVGELNSKIAELKESDVVANSVLNENKLADELIEYLGNEIVHVDVEAMFDAIVDRFPGISSLDDVDAEDLFNLYREFDEQDTSVPETEYQYAIKDSYGSPQAGYDFTKFETWDDLMEYLDENPGVEDRISEGYAYIEEL